MMGLFCLGFLLFLLFRPFARDSGRAAMAVLTLFATAAYFLLLVVAYVLTLGTPAAWIPWAGLIAFLLLTAFTVF
jgi:hypothetical protein